MPVWFWSSLSHGLSIFQEGNNEGKDTLKLETNSESSKVRYTSREFASTTWLSVLLSYYDIEKCNFLQVAQRDEAIGAKTESKSENPAAENRNEADKSVPIVKKDVENVPPQKAPVSLSL